MTPRYYQSVAIHRGTFGDDGRMEFSGTPESTVSGSVFEIEAKTVEAEGEIYSVTAQGFLEKSSDVQRRDQLVIGSKRYEVMLVTSGHDHTGTMSHVGVTLRDSKAF